MKIKGNFIIKKYVAEGMVVSVEAKELAGNGTFTILGIDPEKNFVSPIPFELELEEIHSEKVKHAKAKK